MITTRDMYEIVDFTEDSLDKQMLTFVKTSSDGKTDKKTTTFNFEHRTLKYSILTENILKKNLERRDFELPRIQIGHGMVVFNEQINQSLLALLHLLASLTKRKASDFTIIISEGEFGSKVFSVCLTEDILDYFTLNSQRLVCYNNNDGYRKSEYEMVHTSFWNILKHFVDERDVWEYYAQFKLGPFLGNCGIIILSGVYVLASIRKQKMGSFLHALAEIIGAKAGFTNMIATDIFDNAVEIHILEKQKYQCVSTFKNHRTSNKLGIFSKIIQ